MNKKNLLLSFTLGGALGYGAVLLAQPQAPHPDIDASKHPTLAAAQQHIAEAYGKIEDAQKYYKDELGGHANKAEQLLNEANSELKQAADYASAHPPAKK